MDQSKNILILKQFETFLRLVQKRSAATVRSYLQDLDVLRLWCVKKDLDIVLLNAKDLDRFIEEYALNHASSSINRMQSALRSFYKYLVMEDQIETSPAQKLESLQANRHLPAYYSHKDVEKLIASFPDDETGLFEKAVFFTLYSCGLRVSELCNLQIQDVYLDQRMLRVRGKGDKVRMVPVNEITVKLLDLYLNTFRKERASKKTGAFFVNTRGNNLSRNYVYQLIKKCNERAGITKELSPHSIRHTYASHLLEGKADLRIVQELLGHSDIQTTQIYTHIETSRLKKGYDRAFGFSLDGEDDE